jgi:hypothetical protein
MNDKSRFTLKSLGCAYVLYLSVTGLYNIAFNDPKGNILMIILFSLLAIFAILLFIISYRMYENSKKKAHEEQQNFLSEHCPDSDSGAKKTETSINPADKNSR